MKKKQMVRKTNDETITTRERMPIFETTRESKRTIREERERENERERERERDYYRSASDEHMDAYAHPRTAS